MATSDYEKIRLENIQKNAEFLRELGFNDIHSSSDSKPKGPQLTEKKSIRNLKRKRNVESNKEERSLNETGKDQLPRIGTRQSARIRQGKIETKTVHDFSIDAIRKSQERQLEFIKEYEGNERASIIDIDLNDEHMERNKINAELLRNAIEEASISHSNSISNQDIVKTVHRIQSMGNQALLNRIRAISSSNSNTSKMKMLAFYYGLVCSNLLELANVAYVKLATQYEMKDMKSIGQSEQK